MRSGGEIIVDYLVREKVPYVFGLCGHGNVGLFAYGGIRDIQTGLPAKREIATSFVRERDGQLRR